jgi:hypothetical protein
MKSKKMNKKASVIYWIVFVAIGALGYFFLLTVQNDHVQVRGQWHVSFAKAVQVSEADLLWLDATVIDVRDDAVQWLAAGGYLSQDLGCGSFEQLHLLNTRDTFCEQNAPGLVQEKFTELLSQTVDHQYTITLEDGTLFGVAQEKSYVTSSIPEARYAHTTWFGSFTGSPYYLQYSYLPHFRISVDSFLTNYQKILQEAQTLHTACTNDDQLITCINNNVEQNWRAYNDCTQGVSEQDRKVAFCVTVDTIEYAFALDFSYTQPPSISGFNVATVGSLYQITIPPNIDADNYNIHYTNWRSITESSAGTVNEVFPSLLGPAAEGAQYSIVTLPPAETEECPISAEAGKTYICGGATWYFLDSLPETYFFTVTSILGNEESAIARFVSIP